MDAFLLHALLPELADLAGSRVRSVEHGDPRTIQMDLRKDGESHFLALSCDPAFPRVEPLTSFDFSVEAGPFVRTLRTHLVRAELREIRQIGFDRAVAFRFTKRPAFGAPEDVTLMLNLFGRRANMYLESTSGAFARLGPGMVPRGIGESPTPSRGVPEKLDPLSTTPDQLKEAFRSPSQSSLKSVLVGRFTGISPFWAEEILFRADIDPETPLSMLKTWQVDLAWSHFAAWIEDVKSRQCTPRVYFDPDSDPEIPLAVTPIPVKRLGDRTCHSFERMSDAVSAFYRALAPQAMEDALKQRIHHHLRKKLRRVSKSLQRVINRTQLASHEAEFRRFGELIISNLSALKMTDNELIVINHYDPERTRIRIPADPSKSPRVNAEMYFTKARKAQRSKKALAAERARLLARQEDLQREIDSLPNLSGESLHSRARQLRAVGGGDTRGHREKEQPVPFRTFQTSDGWTVWVGRNDRQNDLLTHSQASPHDYWFHARGLAGSHVVLRRPDRTQRPSRRAIHEAAQIAAYYSKGRNSKTVDVTYTEKKYVRKPKRGKPGLALVTNEKVAFVEPKLPG